MLWGLSIFIIVMLDGLILQVVLTALVIIGAVVAVIWFIWGLKEKSVIWIVIVTVPLGVIVAVVLAILSG